MSSDATRGSSAPEIIIAPSLQRRRNRSTRRLLTGTTAWLVLGGLLTIGVAATGLDGLGEWQSARESYSPEGGASGGSAGGSSGGATKSTTSSGRGGGASIPTTP